TGALGKANGVESMIKLARACEQAGGEIQFLIAGEGSEKKRLEEMASDLGNMRFLPVGDKAMMQRYFSLADAAYISFASVPVLETTSPNKFFDSLAAGKMIIINIPGWIRQITENAGCGFYLNPADPEGGAKMLKALANNPDRVKEFQRQARHLAEDQFEREKLCKQIVSLTTAINGRS
ncbi:MAG: glycosyltransferase, partial [Bacteroidia bacterium]